MSNNNKTSLSDTAFPGGFRRHAHYGHSVVADLTPLSCLTALQSLELRHTQVSDLTPLMEIGGLVVTMPDGSKGATGDPATRSSDGEP